jgi:hypothetical protein
LLDIFYDIHVSLPHMDEELLPSILVPKFSLSRFPAIVKLYRIASRAFWFSRMARFAACGGRRKGKDARTPRAPAGGLAALLHHLLFRQDGYTKKPWIARYMKFL